MREFVYERPTTLDEAIDHAGNSSVKVIAGGTNLVDLMKLGVETPGTLVDVTPVASDAIEQTPAGLLIGAAVRNSALAADPRVCSEYPALSRALLSGASPQIRNAATVAGNLLQRTRCMYFLDTTKRCNKRRLGSGCPALTGGHHNHSILGSSEHCIATHPSDMAVALVALDAVVHIQSRDGRERVPISDFYLLPAEHPERETMLSQGSLVTHVEIPANRLNPGSTYRKVRERSSFAFATASVAASLRVVNGVVDDVRLGLGAVAPVPWRARTAEAQLRGSPATRESFAAAADSELAAAVPLPANRYKVQLMRNLIITSLTELLP